MISSKEKLKIALLVLAALFELVAIAADQLVLHYDDKVSRLEFGYENSESYLNELKLRNKFITKEWHGLRASMEEALFVKDNAVADWNSIKEFYSFLLKFTMSIPGSFVDESGLAERKAFQELEIKLESLNKESSSVRELIRIDEKLLAVNQFFNESISRVVNKMSMLKGAIDSIKVDRHFVLMFGVVTQIAGLLFLLIFLIVEYPQEEDDKTSKMLK